MSLIDTIKHAGIYFLATLLTQALGIVSLPVFTYFMDQASYGIANVHLSYTYIVSVVLALNLYWAYGRYYYEHPETFPAFLSTVTTAMTLVYAVFGAVAYGFRFELARLVNLPAETIVWMLVSAYMVIVWTIFQTIGIAQKHSRRVTLSQVFLHYFKFGCSVLGFVYLVWLPPYMGKIVGEALAAGLVSLYFVWHIRRYWQWTGWRWAYLRYALHFSVPLIPFALGGNLLHAFDQWYINSTLGNEAAGLYGFAYKIGMLLFGLALALLNATEPDYYRLRQAEDQAGVRRQALNIVRLLLLGAGFLVLFSVDMGTLLSGKPAFRQSLGAVPPIVLGYVFFGICSLYDRGIYYLKRNGYLALIVLVAAALNVYLNYRYIPVYGYQAAAYTTLVSYLVMAVLSVLITTFWLQIPPLPLPAITAYLLCLAAVVALYYGLGWQHCALCWQTIPLKLLVFGALAVALFAKNKKSG